MQIALEDIPAALASVTGMSEAAAQVMLSVVMVLAALLPVMYLSRGKKGTTLEVVTIFLMLTLLVGIGWAPFWLLIMACMVVAFVAASFGTDAITGSD